MTFWKLEKCNRGDQNLLVNYIPIEAWESHFNSLFCDIICSIEKGNILRLLAPGHQPLLRRYLSCSHFLQIIMILRKTAYLLNLLKIIQTCESLTCKLLDFINFSDTISGTENLASLFWFIRNLTKIRLLIVDPLTRQMLMFLPFCFTLFESLRRQYRIVILRSTM